MDRKEQQRLEEVGAWVTARMEHLGMSQQDLAAKSSVSTATIRKLQRGSQRSYRAPEMSRLSVALNWPADAISARLRGDAPVDTGAENDGVVRRVEALEGEFGALRGEFAQLRLALRAAGLLERVGE